MTATPRDAPQRVGAGLEKGLFLGRNDFLAVVARGLLLGRSPEGKTSNPGLEFDHFAHLPGAGGLL
jgi:hypothetical protein